MKTFTLKRVGGWYARFRAFEIMVDGEVVAKLDANESILLKVSDDAESLQIKVDWGKTEPLNIRYFADGQVFEIKGQFTLNLIKNVGADSLPIRVTPI